MAGEYSTTGWQDWKATATAAPGPCLSEATWIVSRPEFEGSDRLKSLLLFIAGRTDQSPSVKIAQLDIAREIMGLGPDFDPSTDAHVRIEVGRLRSELSGFYSRLSHTRARRLSIPKGTYRTDLDFTPLNRLSGVAPAMPGEPVIAVGTLCTDDEVSRRFSFELECELHAQISMSAFVSDGLLSFICIDGASVDVLASRAAQLGADVLVVTRMLVKNGQPSVYLCAIEPVAQRLLGSIKLRTGPAEALPGGELHRISASVAAEILDPIGGRILPIVFRHLPESRLFRLAPVFSFMASQDRRLLPAALAASRAISQTSDIAQAFAIDMTRASFCFRTDPDLRDISFLSDDAQALAERAPDNVWATLALGYAGVSSGNDDLTTRAISAIETAELVGTQKADFRLLQSLSGRACSDETSNECSRSPDDPAVFDAIRLGYAALRNRTDESAFDALVNSPHGDVFWIQAFQISAQLDRGQKSHAQKVYGQMKNAHSGIEGYMHRAISTMIPNRDACHRILAGLDSVAC